MEIGLKNIFANGGKVEDGVIYIPVQTPIVPSIEQVPIEVKPIVKK